MKVTSRQRFLGGLIGLSIVASIILTFLFRDQVRVGLVMPISYVVWYVNDIFNTVPQPIFWAVLILFGVFTSMRALFRSLPPTEYPSEPVLPSRSLSRYEYWLWYLNSYQFSEFSAEHMARNLTRLMLEIVAFQEHLTVEQAEEQVISGELVLPDEIKGLIKNHHLITIPPNRNLIQRFIHRFIRIRPETQVDEIDEQETRKKIIHIIKFIEERLEIQYDANP